jgi:ubiquinone/menaquinone biosynthesis C-methylase UbiE
MPITFEENRDASTQPGPVELEGLRSKLTHLYDHNADRYDNDRSLNESLHYYFDHAHRAVDALIGPTNAETLHVDMPVGTGRFLFYLREQGRVHRMVGIDISKGMLEVAARSSVRNGHHIEFSQGDAFSLPFADASVDVLTSLRMFHLFPHCYWPGLLDEMHRVLKPGGILVTELRNAARGTACQLLVPGFRKRRKQHPHVFVNPLSIKPLFRRWESMHMQGVGLDALAKIHRLAPIIAKGVDSLQRSTFVRYFSKTLIIKAIKPS